MIKRFYLTHLEWAATDIDLHVNAHKTEYMYFIQEVASLH